RHDARIGGAALADLVSFCNLRRRRRRRNRLERVVERRGYILWRFAVPAQNRLYFNPMNSSNSPPLPVTVRICLASMGWLFSLSVVSGAPTTTAPVLAPTDAAS